MTEGPYWIDESLTRRDVTEDLRGMPLVVRLTVEIWHAAPDGEYSGFDGSSGSRCTSAVTRSTPASCSWARR